jgi:hypothetical protein
MRSKLVMRKGASCNDVLTTSLKEPPTKLLINQTLFNDAIFSPPRTGAAVPLRRWGGDVGG